jgi:type II secretory pathway pseudopilin PulG
LIELLVVVAIIAVLMMLLLPAIQRVRESANKARCASNLRQIGIAWHMFHHDHGHLPTGGKNICDVPYDPSLTAAERAQCALPAASRTPPDWGCCGPRNRNEWSWTYQILPYIEQETIFRNTNNTTVQRTVIPIYYCPSRRAPLPFGGSPGTGRTDYAGCSGTGSGIPGNGLLVRTGQPTVRLSQGSIPDGTSNTVMLGEKQLNVNRLGQTTDDNEAYVAPGWDADIYRHASAVPQPDHLHPSVLTNGTNASSRFGSSHTASFNAIMGDHSLRQIRYSVNLTVFRRACQRNDNQVYNADDL